MRRPSRLLAGLALLAGLLVPPATAAAQSTFCAPGQAPGFVFGFADLKAFIGDPMGTATTCEFPDPNGTGDVHQRTTTGLAFWRRATNTPTFTNGYEHWGRTAAGWVCWVGSSIDPPPDASGCGGEAPPMAAPGPLPVPVPVRVAPIGTSCPEGYPVKGNLSSSGERIYHVPGGQAYQRTDPEACFATAADAQAAGYRAALR